MKKIIECMFKINYRVEERDWPEQADDRNLILWWEKGWKGAYYYKAESVHYGVIELGDTVEEAVKNVKDNCPKWLWQRLYWKMFY
jgi:hypothetical protein